MNILLEIIWNDDDYYDVDGDGDDDDGDYDDGGDDGG